MMRRTLAAILMVIISVRTARPREAEGVIPGLQSGLLFRPKGALSLATGSWTAVVRFEEEEVRKQAAKLREQFKDISEALIELRRLQGNATGRDEKKRGIEFLEHRMSMWERERNWMEAEVQAAEKDIRQLRAELRLIRRSRSLIPFIGDGLKWLFGTSTEEDTRQLRKEIGDVKTKVGQLHHIAELQTTLISSLKREQRTNQRNIALLAEKTLQLETTIAVSREADHLTMRNIRREIDTDQIITAAIRIAGAETMAFRSEVSKMKQALSHTQQGRVTPEILSPRDLREILKDITQHLPEGWSPAVSKSNTPAEIYNTLDLAVTAIPRGWEVHIKIPLKSRSYGEFHLYQVDPIPTHFLNSSMALKTEVSANYFAISSDQRLHFTARTDDIAKCRPTSRRRICSELAPLVQESRTGCLYHAFRDNRVEAEQACVKRVVQSSPQVYSISETQWLYALPNEELFAMQCAGKLKPTKGFRLKGTGVIALPPGCAAIGDQYIIPAHLKGNLKRQRKWSAGDLAHFKIDLNISGLLSRLTTKKKLNQTMLKTIMETLPKGGKTDPTLDELKEKVENWSDPETTTTEFSFLGHTSISLGAAGLIGVILIAIVLCRRNSQGGAQIIQSPHPANAALIPVQAPQTHPPDATLYRRLDLVEAECQQLQNMLRRLAEIEEKMNELQKKHEDISRMI